RPARQPVGEAEPRGDVHRGGDDVAGHELEDVLDGFWGRFDGHSLRSYVCGRVPMLQEHLWTHLRSRSWERRPHALSSSGQGQPRSWTCGPWFCVEALAWRHSIWRSGPVD